MKLQKRRRGWIEWISGLMLCVVFIGGLAAQTVKPSKAKPQKGTLTGRVFAITNAGDLKPARMASVHIFYYGEGDTAGHIYMQENLQTMKTFGDEMAQNGSEWTKGLACLKDLHRYDSVLLKVLEWSESTKKLGQVINVQTDEDGFFSAALPAGEYIVTVRGRAGLNDALWDTSPLNDVTIKAGAHVEVKLSSPSQSCVHTAD